MQIVHGSFAAVADFIVLGYDHKLVVDADLWARYQTRLDSTRWTRASWESWASHLSVKLADLDAFSCMDRVTPQQYDDYDAR